MRDYVYPSVYFAYFYFVLLLAGAIYFCVRSARHGYWGANSEDAKYRMLQDNDSATDDSNEPRSRGERES